MPAPQVVQQIDYALRNLGYGTVFAHGLGVAARWVFELFGWYFHKYLILFRESFISFSYTITIRKIQGVSTSIRKVLVIQNISLKSAIYADNGWLETCL